MEQIPIATGEFACGASLSALGAIILPSARLSSELNAPKGKPRMRTLSRIPRLFLARRRSGVQGWNLATFIRKRVGLSLRQGAI